MHTGRLRVGRLCSRGGARDGGGHDGRGHPDRTRGYRGDQSDRCRRTAGRASAVEAVRRSGLGRCPAGDRVRRLGSRGSAAARRQCAARHRKGRADPRCRQPVERVATSNRASRSAARMAPPVEPSCRARCSAMAVRPRAFAVLGSPRSCRRCWWRRGDCRLAGRGGRPGTGRSGGAPTSNEYGNETVTRKQVTGPMLRWPVSWARPRTRPGRRPGGLPVQRGEAHLRRRMTPANGLLRPIGRSDRTVQNG